MHLFLITAKYNEAENCLHLSSEVLQVPFYLDQKRKSCWVAPLLIDDKRCCWTGIQAMPPPSKGHREPAPKVRGRVAPRLTLW